MNSMLTRQIWIILTGDNNFYNYTGHASYHLEHPIRDFLELHLFGQHDIMIS